MISYSIIQKSQLEGALRLDAEYYQPEYLNLISNLKSQKSKFLKELADKVFSGPFGSTLKSESYQMYGIPFIRIGDISDVFIERENLVYISEAEHKRIFSTHLNPGDIVFSKIGTIGRLSMISEDLGQVNISENNIGIRLSKLSPQAKAGLLFFLLSKYGQLQILRSASGNIQQKLNVSDIESVKVPILSTQFQKELWELYKKIMQLRKQSESLYSQAEDLLLEELGIKDFEIDDDLSYIVNLSEIKSAHRADAEYFQPKYEKIVSKLKKQNAKPIRELSQFVGHATQSPYDEIGDIAVLAQKHMKRNLAIDTSAFDNYTTENLIKKSDKKFILKNSDVLISSAGEPGLTCVWTEGSKVIPGSFVTIARFAGEIEPFYAGVFLNTIAGRLQFERDYTGSVQQYVYPVKIKEIIIPILPKPTQQKIADLVQKSHEARKKAKELLEEAKQKVENAIENEINK